ncbi:hypothetical protein V8F33_008140 [Rhypophila sp. PSN 637]
MLGPISCIHVLLLSGQKLLAACPWPASASACHIRTENQICVSAARANSPLMPCAQAVQKSLPLAQSHSQPWLIFGYRRMSTFTAVRSSSASRATVECSAHQLWQKYSADQSLVCGSGRHVSCLTMVFVKARLCAGLFSLGRKDLSAFGHEEMRKRRRAA